MLREFGLECAEAASGLDGHREVVRDVLDGAAEAAEVERHVIRGERPSEGEGGASTLRHH